MFKSLQSRLWVTYALLIGIVLVVAGVMLALVVRTIPTGRTQVFLQEVVTVLGRAERMGNLPPARLKTVLLRADENFGVRILILGEDGAPLIDSRSDKSPSIEKVPVPGQLGLDRRQPPTGTVRDTAGHLWMYALRPLTGGHLLMVAVPRPRVPWGEVLRDDLLPPLIRASMVAVGLAILLSFMMSHWVAAPIRKMTRAIRNISSGHYQPTAIEGPSEVQELAAAFNEMTEQVLSSQQSQRDFVANVSHELKTPLTSIQGFAQALLDGTVHDQTGVRQAAEVIYTESSRMHRLVVDLLDLARLDTGTAEFKREPIDLAALLRAAVEKFSPQANEAHVQLQTDIASLPALIGDGDRLAQVFTNLIDNALKHTPEGGVVKISARKAGEQAIISVQDSGSGIPPEELNRIFERFYQLDKSRAGGSERGVGLGLTIAQEIIQAHRGTIQVQSQPGQGTVFVVKIPLVRPDDTTLVRRKTRVVFEP